MSATTPPAMRCIGCGYDLRNLPSQACPECGREFDACDPTTFATPSLRSLDGDSVMWGAVGALIAGGLGIGIGPWFGLMQIAFLEMTAIGIAIVVLWAAMPGVLGRIDEVTHRRAMHLGCALALLVIVGASVLLALLAINL